MRDEQSTTLFPTGQEGDSRFRSMIETLPVAIYTTDSEGLLTHYNPAAVEFSGRVPELGTDRWCVSLKLFHPDGTPMPHEDCPMAVALREGRSLYAAEAIAERPDGTRIWFEAYPTPLRDHEGRIIGGVNMLVDVTDRKGTELELLKQKGERQRAEAALHESEVRYRTLFESIDEGFCVIEMLFDQYQKPIDYRFLETNPVFERQSGLQNAVGRRMRQLAPEHEQHWFDIYGRVALTGQPIRFVDRAEALGRWFDVYAFRVGEPRERKVAVLFNDITERKRAEERERQNLREAEAARREAQKANLAKATFLATMSHELRTPLNAIIGYKDLLDAEIGGPITDLQKQHLDRIEASSRHLLDLIEEILSFSRLKAGREEVRLETADLETVVRSTVELVEPLAAARDLDLTVEIDSAMESIRTDTSKLRQILLNLLSNAIKFTDEGRVRVAAEADADADEIVLAVEDTGIGISSDQQKEIFEAFRQVSPPMGGRIGGTGLGLSVTRQLTSLLGGTVEVESTPGAGSTFTVRLPRQL